MSEESTDNTISSQETEEYSESEEVDFLDGLTNEQKEQVKEKLNSYQNQFRVFNDNQRKQKVDDVVCRFSDVDAKAAQIAIDACRNNELLAIKRLMEDPVFKQTVIDMGAGRQEVDIESILYMDKRQELINALQDADESIPVDVDENENWEFTPTVTFPLLTRKRYKLHSSDIHSGSKLRRLNLDDALIMLAGLHTTEEEKEESPKPAPPRKPRKPKENDDDASDYEDIPTTSNPRSTIKKEADFFRALSGSASQMIPTETLRQLGWSNARIKAFRNREKNPNQYYYRFNDPGEPQATGKWSAKDKELFLKIIREKGVDYQWGIFSMQIPGRVGYQCSNFYRQLIKEGEIIDKNYTMDKDGKLTFQFRDKHGRSTLVRHSKRSQDDDLLFDLSDAEPVEDVNVLPDYIDPMTMMPVEKPAISPYGHVMGYNSWVKLLNRNPKNTCPFTKKKLTRRSLVKLTVDNIDEYRDKIINVNGFDIDFHCD